MSSLPLISHHLFVAAVAPEARRGRRPARRAPGPLPGERAPEPAILELVEPESPRNTRPLKPALAAVL